MHLLVHSLYARARTVLGQWGTGHKGTGPAGNDTKGPVQIPGNAVIQESAEPDFTSVSPVSSENPDTAIPIRICPHCGYEIRTWINGDLSCTRCENDILPEAGMISLHDFQVVGICDVGSRL
jgi:hypothetical protein